MNLRTTLALITAMLFWGSSFVATKIMLAQWPAWAYMFLRFAAASLIFLVILLRRGRLKIPRHIIPRLLLLSLFEPGLYFVFETLGLQHTSAASASIIIAVIPAVVALFSAVFLKERLSRMGWLGTLLSIAGIAIITLLDSNASGGENSLLGNVFTLFAVFSATGYIVMTRSISEFISPLQLTAYQTFFATLFFSPGIVLQGGQMGAVLFDPALLGAFAFLVIGATIGAFLSYNYALSKVSAPQAAVFINGIPVVTVIVAWIVLGETLNTYQILGGIMAISGLMLANRKDPPKIHIEA